MKGKKKKKRLLIKSEIENNLDSSMENNLEENEKNKILMLNSSDLELSNIKKIKNLLEGKNLNDYFILKQVEDQLTELTKIINNRKKRLQLAEIIISIGINEYMSAPELEGLLSIPHKNLSELLDYLKEVGIIRQAFEKEAQEKKEIIRRKQGRRSLTKIYALSDMYKEEFMERKEELLHGRKLKNICEYKLNYENIKLEFYDELDKKAKEKAFKIKERKISKIDKVIEELKYYATGKSYYMEDWYRIFKFKLELFKGNKKKVITELREYFEECSKRGLIKKTSAGDTWKVTIKQNEQ